MVAGTKALESVGKDCGVRQRFVYSPENLQDNRMTNIIWEMSCILCYQALYYDTVVIYYDTDIAYNDITHFRFLCRMMRIRLIHDTLHCLYYYATKQS